MSHIWKSIYRGGSPISRPYKWWHYQGRVGGWAAPTNDIFRGGSLPKPLLKMTPIYRGGWWGEPPLQVDFQRRLIFYSTRCSFVRTGDILIRPLKNSGCCYESFFYSERSVWSGCDMQWSGLGWFNLTCLRKMVGCGFSPGYSPAAWGASHRTSGHLECQDKEENKRTSGCKSDGRESGTCKQASPCLVWASYSFLYNPQVLQLICLKKKMKKQWWRILPYGSVIPEALHD